MPKKIWPREFRKPSDIVTCDCEDPNNVNESVPVTFFNNDYGPDEIRAKCLSCGTSEVYVVVEGDSRRGCYRAVLKFLRDEEEPIKGKTAKPIDSRLASKLNWGVYVPNYARAEQQPDEDRLAWFRRMLG